MMYDILNYVHFYCHYSFIVPLRVKTSLQTKGHQSGKPIVEMNFNKQWDCTQIWGFWTFELSCTTTETLMRSLFGKSFSREPKVLCCTCCRLFYYICSTLELCKNVSHCRQLTYLLLSPSITTNQWAKVAFSLPLISIVRLS